MEDFSEFVCRVFLPRNLSHSRNLLRLCFRQVLRRPTGEPRITRCGIETAASDRCGLPLKVCHITVMGADGQIFADQRRFGNVTSVPPSFNEPRQITQHLTVANGVKIERLMSGKPPNAASP